MTKFYRIELSTFISLTADNEDKAIEYAYKEVKRLNIKPSMAKASDITKFYPNVVKA